MESEKFEKNIYYNVLLRLNYYLLLCIIANMIIYIVGNYKFFLERILIIMLNINTVLAIIEMLTSLISCFFTVYFAVHNKDKRYYFYLIPLVLFFIVSTVIMLFFTLFNYIINGLF